MTMCVTSLRRVRGAETQVHDVAQLQIIIPMNSFNQSNPLAVHRGGQGIKPLHSSRWLLLLLAVSQESPDPC